MASPRAWGWLGNRVKACPGSHSSWGRHLVHPHGESAYHRDNPWVLRNYCHLSENKTRANGHWFRVRNLTVTELMRACKQPGSIKQPALPGLASQLTLVPPGHPGSEIDSRVKFSSLLKGWIWNCKSQASISNTVWNSLSFPTAFLKVSSPEQTGKAVSPRSQGVEHISTLSDAFSLVLASPVPAREPLYPVWLTIKCFLCNLHWLP